MNTASAVGRAKHQDSAALCCCTLSVEHNIINHAAAKAYLPLRQAPWQHPACGGTFWYQNSFPWPCSAWLSPLKRHLLALLSVAFSSWPCSAWLSPLEQHLLVPWRCTVFCNSFLLFNMLTCNQGQQYSCSDQNQQSLRGDAPGRR